MCGTCYALDKRNSLGLWYGGLVLDPDLAGNSLYDLSPLCSVRGRLGALSSEFLFSSDIDFRKFEWCLNEKIRGDSSFSQERPVFGEGQ